MIKMEFVAPSLDPIELSKSLANDVGFLLARASSAALRAANAALEPFGLKTRHYATLQLTAEEDGVSQREIATALGLDPSAVVGLVDDLEELGFVVRISSPVDRRTRIVSITAAGRAVLNTARAAAESVHHAILANLSPKDRQDLMDLLRRIVP
jgi:DNA-binding MarR family transcriptional regulator